jgi:hypothetical protein
MLAHVREHVRERIPDLARRPQDPKVIPIAQHGTVQPKGGVHQPREASTKRLHPAPELIGTVRFDHEVRVIRLDRILDHAKVASDVQRPKRAFELPHEAALAQRRKSDSNLQRHERRVSSRKSGAAAMADARIRSDRATCSATSTAAGGESELELFGVLMVTHRCVE